jgi:DNA-binding response OmpR family regulator
MWRILCIDDEPDILEILKATLSIKYEVVTAKNGVEGVGMLDLCQADFILCDIRMPMMDGFQTVEAIRKHPDYHDIPVFYLTAETGRDKAKKGFESGANLYLTKPFDPMRLLKNIDFFLDESGAQPREKNLSVREVELEMERQPVSEKTINHEFVTEAPVASPMVKPRILVISEDARQMEWVMSPLRDKYECIPCADPMASLQQLFRYDPDIVIMNPVISNLSGWGLVQTIQQNNQLRGLVFILIEDSSVNFDVRMAQAISSQPALPTSANAEAIQKAVERAICSGSFHVRSKRHSFEQLMQLERALQERIAKERQRKEKEENSRIERYRRIQEFIDSHSI